MSILLSTFSCTNNVNVTESYKRSGLKNSLYKKSISKTKLFVNEYNRILKSRVHQNFWREFPYFEDKGLNIDIINSKEGFVQVNIEPSELPKTNWTVYFTPKNTQIFLIELKSDFKVDIPKAEYTSGFTVGRRITIFGLSIVGTPIPVRLKDEFSSVGLYEVKVILANNPIRGLNHTSDWMGTNIIVSRSFTDEAVTIFEYMAKTVIEFQIQQKYINSTAFRNSIAHPELKTVALEIRSRRDRALKGDKEYPFWEFKNDVTNLNDLAKKLDLDESYVNNLLNDNQYAPISGNLLWYFNNPIQYMNQWILLNVILIVLFLIWKMSYSGDDNWLHTIALSILLAINGYAFSKKPDLISAQYWIIPGLLFISNFLLIYFNKLQQLFKS